MKSIIRSGRFYFWPIIAINLATMARSVGGDPYAALVMAGAISCLASFGFLINDLWDREVDRVNNADHFENSSSIVVAVGSIVSACFLLAGLWLASTLGVAASLIAGALAIGLAAYTFALRKILIVPTVAAAVLSTSPLWAPLLLWPNQTGTSQWLFTISFVLIIAGRETLMDCRDRAGDRVGGRSTVAIRFGERAAKALTVALTASAGILLVGVVLGRAFVSPGLSTFSGIIFSAVILTLVVWPAVRALKAVDRDRPVIQRFVLASRRAMLLLPILILLLW